jgi:ABC-type uncharacterized transport system permease subunit
VLLVTLFSIFELYMVGSDATRFVHELLNSANDRPIDIFGARARLFLLYVIPVGAITQIPAGILLGRYSLLEAIATSAWLGVLGLLVIAAWNRGFRRYESAMG